MPSELASDLLDVLDQLSEECVPVSAPFTPGVSCIPGRSSLTRPSGGRDRIGGRPADRGAFRSLLTERPAAAG